MAHGAFTDVHLTTVEVDPMLSTDTVTAGPIDPHTPRGAIDIDIDPLAAAQLTRNHALPPTELNHLHATVTHTGYTDLLLQTSFLTPFLSMTGLTLVTFGVIQGMCKGDVPGNCNLSDPAILTQQLLSSIERIFIIVAIGEMAFLFPEGWSSRPATIAYTFALHLVCLIAAIVASAVLKEESVRHGMGAPRIILAIVIIVIIIPPLIYCAIYHYTVKQRWKGLAIFLLYLTFLIATAVIGGLHVHHWSWGFIYLLLLYPPSGPAIAWPCVPRATSAPPISTFHRVMIIWSYLAAMFAGGVMMQGFAAYGSFFLYISTPFSKE